MEQAIIALKDQLLAMETAHQLTGTHIDAAELSSSDPIRRQHVRTWLLMQQFHISAQSALEEHGPAMGVSPQVWAPKPPA
jgi:hypothetical protein